MRIPSRTTGPSADRRANETASSTLANQSPILPGSSKLPAESPVPRVGEAQRRHPAPGQLDGERLDGRLGVGRLTPERCRT